MNIMPKILHSDAKQEESHRHCMAVFRNYKFIRALQGAAKKAEAILRDQIKDDLST